MAKCIKCGGSFLTRGRIRLADADICFKCFESLGFDRKTGIYDGKSYKWDDIKDGFDAMMAREHAVKNAIKANDLGLTPKLYKQLNNAEATDPEIRLMSAMCALLSDEDRDIDALDMDLGHNGSLLVMIDGVVIIEYKSDSGVKWIRFPHESEEKLRITGPASLNKLVPRIVAAYDSAIN